MTPILSNIMYWCYVYMIYKKVIIIASMTPQTDTSIWKCVRKYNSEILLYNSWISLSSLLFQYVFTYSSYSLHIFTYFYVLVSIFSVLNIANIIFQCHINTQYQYVIIFFTIVRIWCLTISLKKSFYYKVEYNILNISRLW